MLVRILVLAAAAVALAGCGSTADDATPTTAPTTLSKGALQVSSCANSAMSARVGQGRMDDTDSGCPAVRVAADGTCTLVDAQPPVSAPTCQKLFELLAKRTR